jgi:hypothetical protein
MALSQSEIYSLAKSVGLSDSRAKVAAAIAMAESGGNPNAHNAKPPDDSYGLWQINMLGAMGPARRKQFGLSANSELTDPMTNAKAMKAISSSGGNFNPWSTYTNGAYRKYTGNAVSDEGKDRSFWEKFFNPELPGYLGGKTVGETVKDNPITETAQAAAQGAQLLGKTAVWVSNSENWIRVAYVLGGSVIVIAGVVMVVQSTKAGQTVTKAATTVVTKGKL